MNYLSRNRDAYEELVGTIQRLGDRIGPDLRLGLIAQASWFASVNHPGLFADDRIENVALEIGAGLDRLTDRSASTVRLPAVGGRRHVLHVATKVGGIGGHTHTIRFWAETDRESAHSVVLTQQVHDPVPEPLCRAITASGGRVVVLPVQAPPTVKARHLRDLARGATFVCSHHFTEDVLPVAAFATPDLPPIGIVNLMDHAFWLGGSVADTVINLRQIGWTEGVRRRGIRHNTLLPIPLCEPPALDREVTRERLGIPADQTALLSVGRAIKYVPMPTHDFFSTGAALLAEHPGATVYLVGVDAGQARPHLKPGADARFHCLGSIDRPDAYRAAADIYLEGFPFGSQTAMLEAGLAGLAPVPAFNPICPLLVAQDEAFDGLVEAAPDEASYRQAVGELIRSPRWVRELGAECAARVRAAHTGAGWLDRLATVYRTMAGMTHAAYPIPRVPAAAEPGDVGLSLFHAFNTDPGGSADTDIRYKLRQAAFEAAFLGREAGNYLGAWRILGSAKRAWGDDGRLGRARAKLVPHWMFKRGFRHSRVPDPVVLS
jgi:glycosyltransferase involved in cell wall biosynthesis